MKTLFLFPPGWNIQSPHLALPLLRGQLDATQYPSKIHDLNIEFYDYVLSKDFQIKASCDIKHNQYDLKSATALMYSEQTIKYVEKAKRSLRSNPAALNKSDMRFYENILEKALFVASCTSKNVSINLKSISFSFNIAILKEVLDYVYDKKNNIFWNFYHKYMKKYLSEDKYGIIAISLTSNSQLVSTLTLLYWLREQGYNNRMKFILGGNYLSRIIYEWDKIPKCFEIIDYFIIGEGEETIVQIIDAISRKKDINNISNIAVSQDEKLLFHINKECDISKNNPPDFSGMNLSLYFSGEPILPIYASRSCPNHCAFCSISKASGSFRMREAKKVYSEMHTLYQKYNVKLFYFVDETLPFKTMREISQMIADNKNNFYWIAETRFNNKFTDGFCRDLYLGGCRKLQFGLESYNERILKIMNKGIDIETVKPTLVNCLKNQIAVHLFWMFNFPHETYLEEKNTFAFVNEILQISKDFGNDYSSTSMGPFGLDKYSEMYYEPQKFGIKIVDSNEDKELALNFKYVTLKENMLNRNNHEMQLNNEFNSMNKIDIHIVYKLFEIAIGQKYFHFSTKHQYDERMFVQQCLCSETTPSAYYNEKDLNSFISMFESTINLLGKTEKGTYYYIYNSYSNRFVMLKETEYSFIKNILINNTNFNFCSFEKLICYLKQNDIMYCDYDFEAPIESSKIDICRHVYITKYNNHNYLLDLSNGSVKEIGETLYTILHHMQFNVTIENCYKSIVNNNCVNFSFDVFCELIVYLRKLKIVYLY